MHNINYYKKMAFDPRQMQIIRDGLNAGLDVEWYANTSFDYLQMEQIYLALKVGFDDDSLNMLCDTRIPYDSMRQMRESISEQLGIYEKASEDIKKKKMIRKYLKQKKKIKIRSLSKWKQTDHSLIICQPFFINFHRCIHLKMTK